MLSFKESRLASKPRPAREFGLLKLSRVRGKATLQDLGRTGWQHLGVCESGAADEYAFLWAHKLLGNSANTAALEITFGQCEAIFYGNTLFCLTGAEVHAELNGQAIPLWQTIAAQAGDRLTLGRPEHGLVNYLAVAGGFSVAKQCGSYSQCEREALGPFQGRPLEPGAVLGFAQNRFGHSLISDACAADAQSPRCLRRAADSAIAGYISARAEGDVVVKNSVSVEDRVGLDLIPSVECSFEPALSLICQGQYAVSPQSNRMGYRLTGPKLSIAKTELASNGMGYGAVQVLPNGQPIILLKDRQTMGGYPVIGHITRYAACKVAQMRPGQTLVFNPVSRQAAIAQQLAYQALFNLED